MTRLLPDVFKEKAFQDSDDSVLIPDTHIMIQNDRLTSFNMGEESDLEDSDQEEQNKSQFCSQEELDAIKKDAYDQAYKDSFRHMQGEIRNCIDEVGRVLDSFEEAHNRFVEEYANQMAKMAIDIAEKIMLTEIKEDDKCLTELVMHVVSSAKNAEWFSVELSNQLTDLVFWLQNEFEKPEYNNKAQVSAGNYPVGTIRVNTPVGTLDASIPQQIENLKERLEELN